MGLLQEQSILLTTEVSVQPQGKVVLFCLVLFSGDTSIISKALKFVSGLEELECCDLYVFKTFGSVWLPRTLVCGA